MQHRKIVWLASYPKSGNTWVRCFMDAYFLQEVDINDIVCSVSDDLSFRHQIGDGSDIVDEPIEIQMLTRPMALLRLVRTFNENKFADIPLFVKTHFPHMLANGIETLPEALTYSVIHIVRNPLDVLPSFSKHIGISCDEGFDAMLDKRRAIITPDSNKTTNILGAWDDYVNSYIKADTHNVLTIRYEDMLSDPVEEFSKMLRHAGVEPDKDRVIKAIELVKIDKLKKQEDKNGFRESSPKAKNKFFSRTKTDIGDVLRSKVKRKFERVMKRLGYLNSIKRVA